MRVANLRCTDFCHIESALEFHTNQPIRNLKTRDKLRLNFNFDTSSSGKWILQGHLCRKKKLTYQENKLLSRHKDNFREGKLKMDHDKGKIFCVQWQVGVTYRYLTFFKEAFVLFLWDVFLLRIASRGPFLPSK